MKLPNAERAIVDIRKLEEYCLNSQHPRGRHKARVFASVGIRESDAEDLRNSLLEAALVRDVQEGAACLYGQRYILDFDLLGRDGAVMVRSTWIVRTGEDVPRLTSARATERGSNGAGTLPVFAGFGGEIWRFFHKGCYVL